MLAEAVGECDTVCVCFIWLQTGDSCLHIACDNGYLDLAKLLCEAGGQQLLLLTEAVSLKRCAVVLIQVLFTNASTQAHVYALWQMRLTHA